MFSGKVKVRKSQLDYFRRQSRDSAKEIFAFLIGVVVSPSLTRIDRFYYPDYSEQTAGSVRPTAESTGAAHKSALDSNLKVVGSLHSHPDWFPIMSEADYKGHIEDGDRISGIVGINGRRTKVYFWTAESALPCQIEYL